MTMIVNFRMKIESSLASSVTQYSMCVHACTANESTECFESCSEDEMERRQVSLRGSVQHLRSRFEREPTMMPLTSFTEVLLRPQSSYFHDLIEEECIDGTAQAPDGFLCYNQSH
jgi:hypothetical protein